MSPDTKATSLHDKIMRAEPPKDLVEQYEEQSGHSAAVYYKLGHRDGRLDAAALAYEQDALVESLTVALEYMLNTCPPIDSSGEFAHTGARAALAAAQKGAPK